MASYTPPSQSAYNSLPPSDDGTESTANRVDWATIKSKLSDPNKNYADAINSETKSSFDKIDALIKRIEDFGASPTTGFDNKNAFESARVWLASQTAPAVLLFAGGIYEYSVSPNWAVADVQIIASGVVYLRYTGTGNAVIMDGGATGGGVGNIRFGRFIIECPSTALDGFYIRSVHRSMIDVNVRGAGTAKAGVRTIWCVLNKFNITVSVNEAGSWYLGSKPAVGLSIEGRATAEQTSYCMFENPIIEGTTIGVDMTGALGNSFYTGAIEGCTSKGLTMTTTQVSGNKFSGTDFEKNGPASAGPDIECDVRGTEFIGIDTFTEMILQANAINTRIIGGAHRDITIDSGAKATLITNIIIDRFGNIPAGVIDDNGTDTAISNITDNQGNVVVAQGITLNPTSLPAKVAITVTGSPFVYQNTGTVTQAVGILTNQAITSVSYGRIGAAETISTTHGVFDLSPGDALSVAYPGTAPTMYSWDRAR